MLETICGRTRVTEIKKEHEGFRPTTLDSKDTAASAAEVVPWNARLEAGRRALASVGAFMRGHF
jgi:hypothetical protein